MPKSLSSKELLARIQVLEFENKQLTERVEDSVMLGLVAESIEHSQSSEQALDIALERISMLKNIPIALCCSYEGKQLTVLQSYVSFHHGDLNAHQFTLPNKHGMHQAQFTAALDLQLHGKLGEAEDMFHAISIPFSIASMPCGIFVFASHGGEGLKEAQTALQRIVDILSQSMANHNLLIRYQKMNAALDTLVEKRNKDLAASEQRFRALFEDSNTAIMLLNKDHFVDCNVATLRLFGMETMQAFLACHPADLSPETQMNGQNSRLLSQKYVRRAMEYGSYQFEWMHKRQNGEEFLAVVQLTSIVVGQERLVQGTVTDVSKLMRAEKALQASEQKYRNIIENMQDCFYRTDAQGCLVFASPSIQKLMACSADEILGDKLTDYYVQPSRRSELLQLLAASPDGKIVDFEAQVRRKDGELVWLSANTHLIFDEHGQMAGVEGVLRDVTRMKQHEEDLRKLSQAVEQAGESIMMTNAKGDIEYVNPMFSQMTGYAAEEVLGKNWRSIHSEQQKPQVSRDMWDTIGQGNVWESHLVEQRKDGSLYPALLSVSPIFDDHQNITHFVAIHRDMTELQEMEDKFQQAQKMEAMGTLAGGIAHDFNNILAAMMGSAFLAKKSLHAPNNKDLLCIEEQANRAADLIKKLLTFSRKDMHHTEPLSLRSLVMSAMKLFCLSLPEDIAFSAEITEELLPIEGDTTQLQQVVLNLINNAKDALEQVENPRILLALQPYVPDRAFFQRYPDMKAKHHGFAMLTVQDNGHGISAAHMQHIFEPFFTSKEVGKGTGLGLAMIHGTIQSHGGMITVDSKQDEGACFQVYLPLAEASEVSQTEVAATKLEHGTGQGVLLVDDEDILLEVHQEVLKDLGYQVFAARDGKEAIALFTQQQADIDIIIMDVMMPTMGGIEAAQCIRQLHQDVPIIFATGYDRSQALMEQAQVMSDVSIIAKPFDIQLLSNMMQDMLK